MQPIPPIPRAPTQAAWDAMTPAERARVVASLPPTMTEAELSPPEGDPHVNARMTARDSLRDHFERLNRRAYVGSDITVYYPDERRFAPDLFVVLEVEPGDRDSWIVSAEGRGLDLVLEVLYHGDRAKDLGENVHFYAGLGIPEYFVYDRGRQHIHGFRLSGGRYLPILAQHGAYASHALGMELGLDEGRLRFYFGGAVLAEPKELLARVQRVADQLMERLDEAQRAKAEAEQARAADAERAKAEIERVKAEAEQAKAEAERRLAEALALIEQLRRPT